MNKISKRLELIASFIPDNSKVIDIGCDHGLLDIYLYQNKKNISIIASDINEQALNNAKKNISDNRLNEHIDLRLGNGLDVVEANEIDTIIMSGLGSYTIVGILKKNINKLNNVDNIVIQSNTKLCFLRKEITKLKYYISDEEMIYDKGIYYTIIKFKKGKKKYNRKELYFGPILIKNKGKVFEEYNKRELERLSLVLKMLPKNKIIDRIKTKYMISLYNKI